MSSSLYLLRRSAAQFTTGAEGISWSGTSLAALVAFFVSLVASFWSVWHRWEELIDGRY